LTELAANLIAVEQAEKKVWQAIAKGESIAVETVLSTDKFVPIVEVARFRGYNVRLIFVSLPTVELAIERVAVRVRQGGHDVPEAKIRSRWVRAHDNLIRFLGLVDDILVFSNEALDPLLVAERFGATGRLTVYDIAALPEIVSRLNVRGGAAAP
jgi:predicted ABC-type ATPase